MRYDCAATHSMSHRPFVCVKADLEKDVAFAVAIESDAEEWID